MHQTRTNLSRSRGGYSLIEILTVLVLIGILVAAAAPRLDLTPLQSDSAMRQVASRLLASQRLAVARQHDVVVGFDLVENRLRVHADADNDGAIDPGEAVVWEPVERPVVLGVGQAAEDTEFGIGRGVMDLGGVQDGLRTITFHRSGSASEEGGLYLTSARARQGRGKPTDSRALRVERSTGRISWFRYTGSEWEEGF